MGPPIPKYASKRATLVGTPRWNQPSSIAIRERGVSALRISNWRCIRLVGLLPIFHCIDVLKETCVSASTGLDAVLRSRENSLPFTGQCDTCDYDAEPEFKQYFQQYKWAKPIIGNLRLRVLRFPRLQEGVSSSSTGCIDNGEPRR